MVQSRLCTIVVFGAMGCGLAQTRGFAQSADTMQPGAPSGGKASPSTTGALTLPVPSVPEVYADLPYRSSVRVAGGTPPYAITITGDLPEGLDYDVGLDVVVLRGVPTIAGTYTFEVSAVDAMSALRRHSYTLEVHPHLFHPEVMTKVVSDSEVLTVSDAIRIFFPVKIAIAEPFTISDAITEFSPVVIKVPEVLTISDAIAEYSPAMIRDAENLTITDTISVVTTIGVLPAVAATGTYGVPYGTVTFEEVGNTSAPTLSYTGTLPTGLGFSPSGSTLTLSGTPSQAGTFSFTISAKQSNSATVIQIPYTLVIAKAAQSITLGAVPSPSYPGSAFSLSATASSGLPVTITSTSAFATGANPFTPAGAGEATFQATQAGDANYAAANPISFMVPITGTATLSWNPSSNTLFSGQPLGAGVLDATSNAPGTISYTAKLLPSGPAIPVTSLSTLAIAGIYQLTATLTPSDPAVYQSVSSSIQVTVEMEDIFVSNTSGTLSAFTSAGSVLNGPVTGGGIGSAVDSLGNVWSINADGSGVQKFSDAGVPHGVSLSGIAGAAALVVDGGGTVWVDYTNGELVGINSATGAAGTPLGTGSGVSSPQSMSVDTSSNLWIVNGGSGKVTEVLGLATPVDPLAYGVKSGLPATKP